MPSVSVVIPTIGHAGLSRAVTSALRQTHPIAEVLVVADTPSELELPEDERVRLLRVGPGAGGNAARQAGIDAARGDVIALLDDDDEWLPDRLRAQFEAVERASLSEAQPWIATSRVSRVAGSESSVLPTAALRTGEDLPRYLFLKHTPWSGHGFIQASTLLFPIDVARATPFDPALRFHQDISWLLDVTERFPELQVIQVWEPLVVYHSLAGSVSKRIDPLASIEWARDRLARRGKRVLGDFILTQPLGFARRAGAASMVRVLMSGLRYGRPGFSAIVYALLATMKTALTRLVRPQKPKGRTDGPN